MSDDIKFQEDYKYGFKDEDVSILKTDVGLNEDIVKEISRLKNEPEWMLEFRLKALSKSSEALTSLLAREKQLPF